MSIRTAYFLPLMLVCFLLTNGCSKNSQTANEEEQDDLFVEYHDYYFPQKIETLALGDLATYKGESISPFGGRVSKKKWYSQRSYSVPKISRQDLPVSRRQLLRYAESALGTPYVLGGTRPGGFDCSGLVLWAYGNIGVHLPRTAREQSVVGTRVNRIEDMRAGDIVAFRHPKRGYHTGIYIGEGKFIHSPRRKSHVKVNSLSDPYFNETFLGARRINIGSRENLLAQAEERLANDFTVLPRIRGNHEGSRVSRNTSRGRLSHRKSYALRRELKRLERREKSRSRNIREEPKKSKREYLVADNKKSKVDRDSRDKKKRKESVKENERASRDRDRDRKVSRNESDRGKSERKKSAAFERQEKKVKGDKKRAGSRKS